ncbi:cucumisin-like [Vicia villosa]|uniref:cucumisin-like n=1 Tax=Vicia villosa TaxID=3911 RepID=UPI00273C0591|nr:cucumisin-like [Vicia villosa]
MEGRSHIGLLLLLISFTPFLVKCNSSSQENDLKVYIVYTGNALGNETYSLIRYRDLIDQAADSNSAPKSILSYYWKSFSGFAVKLTKKEADRMAGLKGVVSVFPNRRYNIDPPEDSNSLDWKVLCLSYFFTVILSYYFMFFMLVGCGCILHLCIS